MEEKLRTMSLIDDLTGLYNRRGFFTLAQQQMKLTERTKKDMLLFFADLDKMKQINDTLGHQEGDKALVEIDESMAGTDGEVTDELVNRYRNLARGEVGASSPATYTCSPEARPLGDRPGYTMTDWCPD